MRERERPVKADFRMLLNRVHSRKSFLKDNLMYQNDMTLQGSLRCQTFLADRTAVRHCLVTEIALEPVDRVISSCR